MESNQNGHQVLLSVPCIVTSFTPSCVLSWCHISLRQNRVGEGACRVPLPRRLQHGHYWQWVCNIFHLCLCVCVFVLVFLFVLSTSECSFNCDVSHTEVALTTCRSAYCSISLFLYSSRTFHLWHYALLCSHYFFLVSLTINKSPFFLLSTSTSRYLLSKHLSHSLLCSEWVHGAALCLPTHRIPSRVSHALYVPLISPSAFHHAFLLSLLLSSHYLSITIAITHPSVHPPIYLSICLLAFAILYTPMDTTNCIQ